MRQKVEIYHYERTIEDTLIKIKNSSIDPGSKEHIFDFYRDALARGLSKARVLKYLNTLEGLASILGMPFENATREDIAEQVRKIEVKDYADWTKHDFKVILKVFYRFMRGMDDYPDEVRWIKTNFKNSHLLPEEILTEDDIKKMVNSAINVRDKAFILVLYESGCRIGEILSLRIRNVQFDEYGAF